MAGPKALRAALGTLLLLACEALGSPKRPEFAISTECKGLERFLGVNESAKVVLLFKGVWPKDRDLGWELSLGGVLKATGRVFREQGGKPRRRVEVPIQVTWSEYRLSRTPSPDEGMEASRNPTKGGTIPDRTISRRLQIEAEVRDLENHDQIAKASYEAWIDCLPPKCVPKGGLAVPDDNRMLLTAEPPGRRRVTHD